MKGAELRAVRLRLGLTQVEMAKRLDIGVATLKRWERARKVKTIVALAIKQLARGPA